MITSYSKDYSRAKGIVMYDVNPGTYYLMDMEKPNITTREDIGQKPHMIL